MQHFFILFFNLRSANKCLLKVAQFSAQLEKFARAIEIYEQVRHLNKNVVKL